MTLNDFKTMLVNLDVEELRTINEMVVMILKNKRELQSIQARSVLSVGDEVFVEGGRRLGSTTRMRIVAIKKVKADLLEVNNTFRRWTVPLSMLRKAN